jgi:hypothetical protein
MTLSMPPPLPGSADDVAGCYPLRSGYRQCTEFFKTDSKSLFPDGSGHIFNFCLARVFSTQDGARQKLKICSEPSENKLPESLFKNFVHCRGLYIGKYPPRGGISVTVIWGKNMERREKRGNAREKDSRGKKKEK